jgi:hypothetical protein
MFSHRVGKLNAEITRLQGKLAQTGYARVSPEDVADAGLFTRLFSRDHRKRQAASLLSARIEALTLSRSGLFATAYNALQPGLAESRALLHDSSRFARSRQSRRLDHRAACRPVRQARLWRGAFADE